MSVEIDGKHFLIYGPPGSGKTTVAQEICEKNDLDYLSVGVITRREISRGTKIGIALKACLDQVTEYPSELIARTMEPYIAASGNRGFLLDGYPKYKEEVPLFFGILDRIGISIDRVFVLNLDLSEAQARVSRRKICQDCGFQMESKENHCSFCGELLRIREDDSPEIFPRRFNDHNVTIEQTLNNLRERIFPSAIVNVRAERSVSEVVSEIYAILTRSPGSSAERACA